MAIKTRTPRQSSGANKERKILRTAAQEERKESNLRKISHIDGEAYRHKTLSNGQQVTLRPSKALRRAERARRFSQASTD